jgi:hypothetical protein
MDEKGKNSPDAQAVIHVFRVFSSLLFFGKTALHVASFSMLSTCHLAEKYT